MSKIILNGKEISKEDARYRLNNADPILGLVAQSYDEDAIQTLVLVENKKIGFNSVAIIAYEEKLMTRFEKLVLKFALYVFNRKS